MKTEKSEDKKLSDINREILCDIATLNKLLTTQGNGYIFQDDVKQLLQTLQALQKEMSSSNVNSIKNCVDKMKGNIKDLEDKELKLKKKSDSVQEIVLERQKTLSHLQGEFDKLVKKLDDIFYERAKAYAKCGVIGGGSAAGVAVVLLKAGIISPEPISKGTLIGLAAVVGVGSGAIYYYWTEDPSIKENKDKYQKDYDEIVPLLETARKQMLGLEKQSQEVIAEFLAVQEQIKVHDSLKSSLKSLKNKIIELEKLFIIETKIINDHSIYIGLIINFRKNILRWKCSDEAYGYDETSFNDKNLRKFICPIGFVSLTTGNLCSSGGILFDKQIINEWRKFCNKNGYQPSFLYRNNFILVAKDGDVDVNRAEEIEENKQEKQKEIDSCLKALGIFMQYSKGDVSIKQFSVFEETKIDGNKSPEMKNVTVNTNSFDGFK